MARILTLAYGTVSYALFLFTFLYAIGFLGNFGVPKTLDSGPTDPWSTALAIDLGLLSLFAIQHSVMARQGFKRALTRVIPVAAERSTYVLASSLALLLLFAQWRPLGGEIWNVQNTSTCSACARSGCTSAVSRRARCGSSPPSSTASCGIRSTSAGCSRSGARRP
jgi:hypothetical protein